MTSPSNSLTPPDALDVDSYRDLVRLALAEDVGPGDLTTTATVPANTLAAAVIRAREDCVVAGLDVVRETFRQVDAAVTVHPECVDGSACAVGSVLARVHGPARAVLTGERTALNFLQHLSGIATLTRRYVDAAGAHLTILDTRKTIPTLRVLAKYAVRCGGATNHRVGLYDAILIKDNHIWLAGGLARAVADARAQANGRPIEVETESLAQVDEALAVGADVIMLDNFSDADLALAIARIDRRARVEVSGGITLARIARLVEIGADSVSVGALTHSAPAVDLSLDFEASP